MMSASTLPGVPTGLFIGGQWEDAHATYDVENPATGRVLASVADGTAGDARRAMDAAVDAQTSWAQTAPRERSEILRRAYELVVERTDEFARVMTLEMGKPFAEARGEVAYGAEFLRWFSEEAVRISGDTTTTGDGRNRIIVSRVPVGPCVLVTPWNFPLAMGTRKIGPAVAAGCTMVFKPAHQTPLTALLLTEILSEAGLPDGVLNTVTGMDASAIVTEWMESGHARKVSFTGSTNVGKILLKQAAENVMRSSMELGGNAPFIVCADADIDKAVDGAMIAKLRNMGEACTAANRFYVHRTVAQEFTTKLADRMAALTVGDGLADGTAIGPLVDAAGLDKVESLVRDAVSKGARVVTGGERVGERGYFYRPTVLTDVPTDAQMASTEIFGPVAPIYVVDDDDAAITAANDTEAGLVAYLYTQDIDRAWRLSDRIEAGMVGVNTGLVSNPAAPFGGIKESGLGREGGRVGIEEFLEYKYLAIPKG
ncbi:MAG: NAD-dependent succinate-semialdehyde dehydrogenase [Rhodococcus sp.]|nr:NAD-dependent succinate-semialdehyde dehydrogenase [Rhodococcus sp. (in: high G+C Gram-positive bacteria)]